MKKLWILITVLALIAAMLAAHADIAENPTERFCGCWQDPYYGRAMLTIIRSNDADMPEDELWYDIMLRWGSSADSEGIWKMSARYDEAADALVYQNGSLSYVTYAEGGDFVYEEIQWDDAEGSFTPAEGKLLWADTREERAAEFAFEPVPKLAPDAAEIREKYFEAVAGWEPGTAGSSLKLAGLCADLLRFANEYRMWDADIPALRENMLDAWSMLDESTKRRFDEDLPSVTALMDAAFSDYTSVKGQFEDAGAESIAALISDAQARASWEMLIAHTYTMGNSAIAASTVLW